MQTQLTDQSRRSVCYAQEEALQQGSPVVEPEHLLLGLLREDHSQGRKELIQLGMAPRRVMEDIGELIKTVSAEHKSHHVVETAQIPLSPTTMQVMKCAATVAVCYRTHFVGPQHILQALIREPTDTLAIIWKRYGARIDLWDLNGKDIFRALETAPEHAPVDKGATKSMWGRFTDSAKSAVLYAQQEASFCEINSVSVSHLLAGVLQEKETMVAHALEKSGVGRNELRELLLDHLETGCGFDPDVPITLTPSGMAAIREAYRVSKKLAQNHIGTEHLFLGIMADRGSVGDMLRSTGLTTDKFLQAIDLVTKGRYIQPTRSRSPLPAATWLALVALIALWVWAAIGQ